MPHDKYKKPNLNIEWSALTFIALNIYKLVCTNIYNHTYIVYILFGNV